MDNGYYNALCFCKNIKLAAAHTLYGRINYAARSSRGLPSNAVYYQYIQDGVLPNNKNLFLPSLLLEDKTIDAVTEYAHLNDCSLIVMAAYELEEAGIIDARFHITPVQLLYRLGILNKCMIAGGAALLNEDLDLLKQENIPLILLPTHSARRGYGFAPLLGAVKRGIKIYLGTGEDVSSMEDEAKFLYLSACADLKTPDAVPMKKIMEFISCN